MLDQTKKIVFQRSVLFLPPFKLSFHEYFWDPIGYNAYALLRLICIFVGSLKIKMCVFFLCDTGCFPFAGCLRYTSLTRHMHTCRLVHHMVRHMNTLQWLLSSILVNFLSDRWVILVYYMVKQNLLKKVLLMENLFQCFIF